MSDEAVANGMADAEVLTQEERNFENVINAFRYYKAHALLKIRRQYLAYSRLTEPHRQLLHPTFPAHLVKLKDCAVSNAKVLGLMVDGVGSMFENVDHDATVESSQLRKATEFNMDKLQSTLRQFVREWSEEGRPERDLSFGPILQELQQRFPNPQQRQSVRVLLPGAGLGRLAFEVARLGFESQGNEFSLFMLFCSNFILNRCSEVNCMTLYPWIHQSSNVLRYEDQARAVQFPDTNPRELPQTGTFSMAAGDFVEVYRKPEEEGAWDAIVTLFFLDTAQNLLEYLDVIRHLLKPNGVWINLGPLLYHFVDEVNVDSIEVPLEELHRLVEKSGFRMESQSTVRTSYTQNPRSMLQYLYDSAFFTCVKID